MMNAEAGQNDTSDALVLYEEDIVALEDSKGYRIGIVENAHNPFDFDFSFDVLPPPQGYARINWYPGVEDENPINKTQLIERAFMPGDVVRSVRPGSYKAGIVTEVHSLNTLHIYGTNQIIEGVDARKLEQPTPYHSNSADMICVELNGWIGECDFDRHSVEKRAKITVKFQDGAICKVMECELDRLNDIFDIARAVDYTKRESDIDPNFPFFFKGQVMEGVLFRKTCRSEHVEWIRKTKTFNDKMTREQKRKPVKVEVIDVEPLILRVNWIACSTSDDVNPKPPADLGPMDIRKLRYLDPHVYASIQIGDIISYTVQSADKIVNIPLDEARPFQHQVLSRYLKNPVMHTTLEDYHLHMRNLKNQRRHTDTQVVLEVDPVADYSHNNDAAQPDKKRIKQMKNFERQQELLKKAVIKPGEVINAAIIYSQMYVNVQWQDGTTDTTVNSLQFLPIINVDDAEFFPGDFVIRVREGQSDLNESTPEEYGVVQCMDHAERTVRVKWLYSAHGSVEPVVTIKLEEISAYEIKDHPQYHHYRPGSIVLRHTMRVSDTPCRSGEDRVGSVISLNIDGTLSVVWVDGCKSNCTPEQLILQANPHEDSSAESWETMSQSSREYISSDGLMSAHSDSDSDDSYVQYDTDSDENEPYNNQFTLLREFKEKVSALNKSQVTIETRGIKKGLVALCNELSGHLQVLSSETQLSHELANQVYKALNSTCRMLIDFVNFDNDLISWENRDSNSANQRTAQFSNQEYKTLKTFSKKVRIGSLMYMSVVKINEALQSTSIKIEFPIACAEFLSRMVQKSILEALEEVKSDDDELILKSLELCKLIQQVDEEIHNGGNTRQTQQNIRENVRGLLTIQNQERLSTSVNYCLQVLNKAKLVLESHGLEQPKSEEEASTSVEVKPEAADVKSEAIEADADEDTWPIHGYNDTERFKLLSFIPKMHAFYNSSQHEPSNIKLTKTIAKHLKILNSHLPDGILVRVYEDRMDCFSAMIIGAAGTPYEDGLFIFDIYLPQLYPSIPLMLHYHSYSQERLNPNLYTNGLVCASFLYKKEEPKQDYYIYLLYFDEDGYSHRRSRQHHKSNSVIQKHRESPLQSRSRTHHSHHHSHSRSQSHSHSRSKSHSSRSPSPSPSRPDQLESPNSKHKSHHRHHQSHRHSKRSSHQHHSHHQSMYEPAEYLKSPSFKRHGSRSKSEYKQHAEVEKVEKGSVLDKMLKKHDVESEKSHHKDKNDQKPEKKKSELKTPVGSKADASHHKSDRGKLKSDRENGKFEEEKAVTLRELGMSKVKNKDIKPTHTKRKSTKLDKPDPVANKEKQMKVCSSLLGTWSGKSEERWNPDHSNILQALISTQGLILTAEPYYNEAGYEAYKGTDDGNHNSKHYNEMVIIKVVQSMNAMLERPHDAFKKDILDHWRKNKARFLHRMRFYTETTDPDAVSFPLLPLSRGCVLALNKVLDKFNVLLHKLL